MERSMGMKMGDGFEDRIGPCRPRTCLMVCFMLTVIGRAKVLTRLEEILND